MKLLRYARDALVFAPCYVALDWASYIAPLGPFNITPWSPQSALALVWMLLSGLQQVPVVMAAIFVADVLVRETPGGPLITAITSLTVGGGYAAIVRLLREFMPDARLRSARQLTLFVTVVLCGSALISAAFVGILRAGGVLADTPMTEALVRFWVGDAVGMLVTAPLLLAAADAQQRAGLLVRMRRPETLLQVALLVATMWVIFRGLGGDPAHHFYLLFIPLIWICARGGMEGAVLAAALVQLGVVAGTLATAVSALPVLELQSLVAALTLTGLYLGMMVDERSRAEAGLRESLRLAAAGEMAGAIAHEVSQPLTALINYGRSAQMLLAGARMPQLEDIIRRMLHEADRAGDVVRRLRDFFRAGSTRLERVEVGELLEMARRTGESAVGARPISITTRTHENLRALFVDRLQVELILRNLLANAIDSLAAAERSGANITLSAEPHDIEYVRIVVADNGPGVGDADRERVFEPFVSGKPTGMGLGLAVSRAIAEAHGGSLAAAPSGHGEFHLVLPCAPTS